MLQVTDIPTDPLNPIEQPLLGPWNKKSLTSPKPDRRTHFESPQQGTPDVPEKFGAL